MTNSLAIQALIVDDDHSVRFFLQEVLERDGYNVTAVECGEDAIQLCQQKTFALALLDLRLNGMDGMAALREIRKHSPTTAIILLTGHASLETAVEALRQGASDYLFKPCKTIELRHSVSVALQKRQKTLHQQALLLKLEQTLSEHLVDIRSATTTIPATEEVQLAAEPDDEKNRFLRNNTLIIDLVRHAVTLDGVLLELSPTEFNLLAYLVSESPRVISPQELVREVQGYVSDPWEARDLARFHVYRLRQKIKATTGRGDLIITVRGVGYTITSP